MPRPNRAIPPLTEQEIKHFWSLVDKSDGQGPKGECWEWIAGKWNTGYGCFNKQGEAYIASRVAYMLTHGTAPQYNACHSCDNPPCCNPAHIWDGDAKANLQDASNKGRLLTGDNNGARRYPERILRGGRNPAAKLTEDQVYEMRRLFNSGEVPNRAELGRRFRLSKFAATAIINGTTWKHLL